MYCGPDESFSILREEIDDIEADLLRELDQEVINVVKGLNALEQRRVIGTKKYHYDVYTIQEICMYSNAISKRDINLLKKVPCKCRPLEDVICPKCSLLFWYKKINYEDLI